MENKLREEPTKGRELMPFEKIEVVVDKIIGEAVSVGADRENKSGYYDPSKHLKELETLINKHYVRKARADIYKEIILEVKANIKNNNYGKALDNIEEVLETWDDDFKTNTDKEGE